MANYCKVVNYDKQELVCPWCIGDDAHAGHVYDSDLKEMGDPAFQLLMGGSLTFTDDVYLDISVAEDISTLTAAAVAFQLALAVTF